MANDYNNSGEKNYRISVVIVSFLLPIVGIFMCISNWKENFYAAKIYGFSAVAGFVMNFIFAPMVF
ncbi:MAG: hypothetical protein FWB80_01830 [Defluviitaleaceae bacterium]|nr:hypothetical protein [Defluviitaleaceae bacterium]